MRLTALIALVSVPKAPERIHQTATSRPGQGIGTH
jgi:hypothetical protein